MMKIGLLSDTHGFVDKRIFEYFADCNEIWHAGDIGNIETADSLSEFKTFRAVYGNIDGHDVRMAFPESLRFMCENVDVFIKHIGGYPGKYDRSVVRMIRNNPPRLFISGHSHILKVMFDKEYGLLHINPGAAGKTGMHKVQTMARFNIDKDEIKNLEIIEFGERNDSIMSAS